MTKHAPHAGASFAHQACVYGSDREFLAMAEPFVRNGLARGEPVLAVTTAANIELLQNALRPAADLVDYAETAYFGRRPPQRVAAFDGYWRRWASDTANRQVRILAEPMWFGRSRSQVVEWMCMEAGLNMVLSGTNIWMICPYDTRVVDPAIVASAYRTHPDHVAGQEILPSAEYVDPPQFARAHTTDPLAAPPSTAATLPFIGDLHSVRQFVANQAAKHGVTTESATILVALASELATHVVKYGSGRAAVRVWPQADHIVCDVHDPTGRITDPFLGYRPPTLSSEPGEGLWLARQISDLVEIRSGESGCTLRLHIPHPTLRYGPQLESGK